MIKSKVHLWVFISMLIILIAGYTLVFFIPPANNKYFPGCFLKERFNYECSGCGATRSVGALAKGDIMQSLAYNPLVLLLMVPLYLFFMLNSLVGLKRGKGIVNIDNVKMWPIIALVIFFFSFGLIRNIKVKPFTYLVPHELNHSK